MKNVMERKFRENLYCIKSEHIQTGYQPIILKIRLITVTYVYVSYRTYMC